MTTTDGNNPNDSTGGRNGDTPATPSSHSPEDSVEKAFGLLQDAKAFEANAEYWKAAELYVQAQQLLQALSDEASREVAAIAADVTSSDKPTTQEEQEQIARLYRDKAQEYWSQSRHCLIQAMQHEKSKDEVTADNKTSTPSGNNKMNESTSSSLPPLICNLIDDDQAKSRNHTFTVLFSRPIEDKEDVGVGTDAAASNNDNENVLDQQWSLEERLQELNKSLPSGFKTDEERMSEINRGLNKLGLSLYTQKQPFARFQDELKPPKSEDEQIEEIMAQAQDEVAFAKSNGDDGGWTNKPTGKINGNFEDDFSEDDDDDISEKGDELLEDDQLALKTIRKKVIKAQVKIAELVALLDQAKIAKDKEHKADDDSSNSGNSGADAFLTSGKKKLRSAQRDLQKAMEEWNDAFLVVNRAGKTETMVSTESFPTMSMAEIEDDSDDEAPDLIAVIDNDQPVDSTATDPSTELDHMVTTNVLTGKNMDSLPPCPVTILSGFLGSGKTTLIQYILKSPDHGKRIAVIENEFGEGLAVESLIARDGVDPQSNSLQDLIELPNGCICCSVKDTLVATLENLLEKRQDLDYILIEASGMANPGPIASVFWLDDALDSRLKLDGIVTLVDGVHILDQLKSTEEAAQQIAYADRIVLNKVDLLENETNSSDTTALKARPSLDQVEKRIREVHPTAPILQTSFSKIPNLDWILNANCFGGADRLEELESAWENAGQDEKSAVDDTHDHHHRDHEHDDHDCDKCQTQHHELKHHHTASISTIALQETASVDLDKLNAWLAEILWPNQDEKDQVLTAMLHQSADNGIKESSSGANNVSQLKTEQQIFRMKGIVSAYYVKEDEDDNSNLGNVYRMETSGLDRRRFILQAVHDLWEVYPASDDLMFQPNEERACKVIVIGKFLNEAKLRSGFRSCFPMPTESIM
ncbi:CobW/hypB/UreG, nucleotide-binding domain containing protein [Nitzschia inconspicua]|uniref:CobW/hypB/UreG, nucleotide-binding domain containing protein n=1 Tax=Nitzschia inconspicua TaxID=303405 RepID=A0A9K3L841_9STRA|nr:CobW/hypB/UreG, nucleotide-binding domain containing protein [Nitzschia inconspicua]